MKKLLCISSLVFLTACSSNPTIPGYQGPHALDRGGVVQGSRDCISNRMKPKIVYLTQKTEFGLIQVPVDVQCDSYSR